MAIKGTDPLVPIKDIRVEVRVRNNLILSRMEHRGIKSVAELAQKMDVERQATMLHRLINMTKAAKNKDGKWHGLAYKLADFFDCIPDDLFSDVQQEFALEKNRSHSELAFADLQRLSAHMNEPVTPELALQADQLRGAIRHALTTLTPREERVIRLRFGFDGEDFTLDQIAEMFGISRERVRQTESKALRKLKHPSRTKALFATAGIKVIRKRWWKDQPEEVNKIDPEVFKGL